MIVLPCIGSVTHVTFAPDQVTASTIDGSTSRTWPAPMRVMNVSRPGTFSGFSRSVSARASCGVVVGPSFTPIGLAMRDMKSTWAPSSWRVRSPIHRKCALVS